MKVQVEYSFASEAPGSLGEHQKRMLQLNLRPAVIFDDLLVRHSVLVSCAQNPIEARSDTQGLDWKTGATVPVPSVSLYTGGFECQARRWRCGLPYYYP